MNTLVKSILFAAFSSLTLPACQTIPATDTALFDDGEPVFRVSGYERTGFMNSEDFLPPKMMESPYHRVDFRVFNDGIANNYKIDTPNHVYVVQGTSEAIQLINEIKVTETLREQSTLGIAGQSVKARIEKIVRTPVRAGEMVITHAEKVETVSDAVLFVPSSVAQIVVNLTEGLKEMGVTGLRLTESAANTRCRGFQCAQDIGKDAWYGVNSILGKHTDARNLHHKYGTDPETQNQVLRREVDRLAYSEAYSGQAFKYALGAATIPIVSDAITGIGYYNHASYVSRYEDALKQETRDKHHLADWGVNRELISEFYQNEAYTRPMRAALVASLQTPGLAPVRVKFIQAAKGATNRYLAGTYVKAYAYVGHLDENGLIGEYVLDGLAPIAFINHGVIIMPLVADYATWTPEAARIAKELVSLKQSHPNISRTQIHLLGKSSPQFKRRSESLGVNVIEIAL